MKQPCVYIMASQRNGTLYIGVTSNLIQRVWQHREDIVEGFTQDHGVKTLMWFEQHETMESAITREKAIKKWNRAWKLRVIEEQNPEWNDLWFEIIGQSDVLARHSHDISRHPREGGDPATQPEQRAFNSTMHPTPKLDSRLRGNDGNESAGGLA